MDIIRSSYVDGGVLKNKLGVTDNELLHILIKEIVDEKLDELQSEDYNGFFNLDHLLDIHEYIYDDVYDFAGIVDSRYAFLSLYYTLDFADYNIPNITTRDEIIKEVSFLYSEILILRPFKDGNKVVAKEFLRQFVNYLCSLNRIESYYLDYSLLDDEELDAALLKASEEESCTELEQIFASILKEKESELCL